ncbi:cyclic nucleotide-binding domain-containing protein [Mesorhizobium sp. M1A.F.Ca.IN.020.03.1.1]|uniref:cyclic nucleotide-binding domain-containing protein n=1 Tax=Mesorhizobium sp. M1A.F.Ca.IN.020.03.1.1 TaxID=2496764 RepID=UPI001FE0586D|nr:cyclic nucleotide-binding domain-containing protein [Mesorhizobium sp. M1A.F.Ca.IN.020.03.1.1]
MAPSVSPTIAARRDQMFPVLADADIERMRRFGVPRAYGAGEHIVTAGTVSPGLVVILSGKVDITQASGIGPREAIITYGPGNFIGELGRSFRAGRRWSMPRRPSRSKPSSSPRSGCAI